MISKEAVPLSFYRRNTITIVQIKSLIYDPALDNIRVNSSFTIEFANVAETLLDVLDGEENRLVKEPIPRDLTVTDLIAFYIKEEIIKQAEDLQFINEADGADEEYEFLAN
ncbi:hypothetical protein QL285_088705 [Trifolium repens]|jgi:hypothetical protein|nr:hypothetical protein QL285_088705 [Trifolium repens]